MRPDCYRDLPLIFFFNLYKEGYRLLRGFFLLRILTGMSERSESTVNTGLLVNHQGQKYVGIWVKSSVLWVKTCNKTCQSLERLCLGVKVCSNGTPKQRGKNL